MSEADGGAEEVASPVLEEALQGFADGIALRWSEQMLQLLVEGPALDLDVGRQDLCDPL